MMADNIIINWLIDKKIRVLIDKLRTEKRKKIKFTKNEY